MVGTWQGVIETRRALGRIVAGNGDRYVIAELNGSGHRFWYVSLVLRWLAVNDPSAEVTLVTTPSAKNSTEWDAFISNDPLIGWLDVVIVESARAGVDPIATMLARPNTRLVVPDGDVWLRVILAATLRGRIRPEGTLLILRPFRARGIGGGVRHLAKLFLMRTLTLLAPNFNVLKLAPSGTRANDPDWVSDPTELNPRRVTRTKWYEGHGLQADQRHLVVLGDLGHRKCVPELLEAFEDGAVRDWHLVLVGRLGTREQALVAARSAAAQYSVIEGFASDQDFDTWIAQADAVAILHRNEGASGILGKCAEAGVPVLVGGARSLLEATRVMGLPRQELANVSPQSICAALPYLPTRADLFPDNAAVAGTPSVPDIAANTGSAPAHFATRILGR